MIEHINQREYHRLRITIHHEVGSARAHDRHAPIEVRPCGWWRLGGGRRLQQLLMRIASRLLCASVQSEQVLAPVALKGLPAIRIQTPRSLGLWWEEREPRRPWVEAGGGCRRRLCCGHFVRLEASVFAAMDSTAGFGGSRSGVPARTTCLCAACDWAVVVLALRCSQSAQALPRASLRARRGEHLRGHA